MHVPRFECVEKGKLVEVNEHLKYRQDIVRAENGTEFPYTYVDDDYAAVATVAMDKQHGQRKILLVPQFRYPSDTCGWEVPCGAPNKSESQLSAAKREFREEAGYEASLWHQLPQQVENVGRGNSRSDVFAAANVTAVSTEQEVTEAIGEARWFTLTEIEDMMLDRRISAGHTMASIAVANAFVNRMPDHPISQLVR